MIDQRPKLRPIVALRLAVSQSLSTMHIMATVVRAITRDKIIDTCLKSFVAFTAYILSYLFLFIKVNIFSFYYYMTHI